MLDLDLVRAHFPAFDDDKEPRFFENAGGSFPCRQTVDTLETYYRTTKVQPYAAYPESARAGDAMDRSYERWAEALGVNTDEIVLGPSTSMNTYVLAHALGARLGTGDEVIVTNQDHEANTGATRRMIEAAGATMIEWRVDADTGILDVDELHRLLTERTRLITFPHCSNIVGTENDTTAICAAARDAGAWTIVDGVSYAPHGFVDVGAMGADVYLFSLYKTYSVHQGLMVLRESMAAELPNQGHYFNASSPRKAFAPAGPDHAQVATAGAVLDYVDEVFGQNTSNLREASEQAMAAWQAHEAALLRPVLSFIQDRSDLRLLGPAEASAGLHRCPTVAFVSTKLASEQIADRLVELGIMASWGDFYANRLLEGLGVDPITGAVRLSWVHYTSAADIDALLAALDQALATA